MTDLTPPYLHDLDRDCQTLSRHVLEQLGNFSPEAQDLSALMGRIGLAAKHPREFGDAGFFVQQGYLGNRPSLFHLFAHDVMRVRQRGVDSSPRHARVQGRDARRQAVGVRREVEPPVVPRHQAVPLPRAQPHTRVRTARGGGAARAHSPRAHTLGNAPRASELAAGNGAAGTNTPVGGQDDAQPPEEPLF